MINIDIQRGDSSTFTLTFNDAQNQPINLAQYDSIQMDLSASPVVPTQNVKLNLDNGLSVSGSVLTISLTPDQTFSLRGNKYYSDLKFIDNGEVKTMVKIEYKVVGTSTKTNSTTVTEVVVIDKWVHHIDTLLTGNSATAFSTLNSGQFVVYGLNGNLTNELAGFQYIEISSMSNNGTSYIDYFAQHAVVTGVGQSISYNGTIEFIDTNGNSLVFAVIGQYQATEDRIQFDIQYQSGNGVILPDDEVQIIFNLIAS